jgi:hypothetical protein
MRTECFRVFCSMRRKLSKSRATCCQGKAAFRWSDAKELHKILFIVLADDKWRLRNVLFYQPIIGGLRSVKRLHNPLKQAHPQGARPKWRRSVEYWGRRRASLGYLHGWQ